MKTGNSIIIHVSAIIQQGLKNILLLQKIVINDIMITFPEIAVLHNWKNMLLFVDMRFADEIKINSKILKKNGNTVIGIETAGSVVEPVKYFDAVLNIYDTAETLQQKIGNFIFRIPDTKSNNQLSAREVEILTRIAQGFSNKLIADQLFLSIHTVITHRKNITSKLGIKSISGLTLYAALNNMVDSHS